MRTPEEVAELIERGLQSPNTVEDRGIYLSVAGFFRWKCKVCALGLAYVGLVNGSRRLLSKMAKEGHPSRENLSKALNISSELAIEIDRAHHRKRMPAATIAQKLKAGESLD